jgi:magnesium and cobalt exporter, CNNM family
MTTWGDDLAKIFLAFLLVGINGFFVTAEFALVKVRRSRLDELAKQGRTLASIARWLMNRLDASLSACQLGITMASLGLGWIGEPAVASLLRPALEYFGILSEMAIHAVAFGIAFTLITATHLVLGEQAPKIAAIRRPEAAALWCALPMKCFYVLFYPLLAALSSATSFLLRAAGLEGKSGYEIPHSEQEIRALVQQAHIHGQLSRSEQRLISAVFDFDQLISRGIMVPRVDVVFLDVTSTRAEIIRVAKRYKHSRYPVCDGSMDHVLGVVHIKDLISFPDEPGFDLKQIMRPAQFVPETVPVRRLLRHFQTTHQHMAFLVDEHGTISGIVTMEDVLEQIIGSVEDEFDQESPDIVGEGPLTFVVSGSASLDTLNRRFGLAWEASGMDTISGLLMTRADRLLRVGDRIELPGALAEVLTVEGQRATRIRLTLSTAPSETL